MFKKLVSLSGVISFIFFLLACQEQSTNPLDENSHDLTLNKGGVVQSASGSGHFEVVPGELRVFTHNGRIKANGSVDGSFMLNRHDTGTHFNGSVICLNIVGNVAFFAGVINTSNLPNDPNWDPGSFVIWSTIDNGEGANTPPDQISQIFGSAAWTQADVELLCESGFIVPYYDITQGNIQIK
jgi:hypothetical protein